MQQETPQTHAVYKFTYGLHKVNGNIASNKPLFPSTILELQYENIQ